MSDTGNLPFEPVPEDQLRVGDTERHKAATALGEHFATGRLDQQEFDERVQAAYAARTRVDLRRLFLDLPEPAPFRAPAPPARVDVPTPATRQGPWQPRRFPVFLPVLPLLFVALIAASFATRLPLFPLFFIFMWLGWGRWAW